MRHFMGTSTFAEYTVMPEIALAKVSPEAPLEGCAPFACGLATGIGAALYTADVEPGSTCVVFGCGLVGLGAVIGCRLAGAERIIAIDLSEERLAQARHHGATDTRLAGDDAVDWIRRETGGFGADYTFEATGNVAVMRQAVEAAREAWGLATMVGVAGQGRDARHRPALPHHRPPGDRLVVRRRQGPRRRCRSSSIAGSPARSTSSRSSRHRLTLDEVNRGFELMEAQDGIRSVIAFSSRSNVRRCVGRGRIYPDAIVRPLTRHWLVSRDRGRRRCPSDDAPRARSPAPAANTTPPSRTRPARSQDAPDITTLVGVEHGRGRTITFRINTAEQGATLGRTC